MKTIPTSRPLIEIVNKTSRAVDTLGRIIAGVLAEYNREIEQEMAECCREVAEEEQREAERYEAKFEHLRHIDEHTRRLFLDSPFHLRSI